MRTLLSILSLVFALQINAQIVIQKPATGEPDHLVPVDPYPGDRLTRYAKEFRLLLKLDPSFYAQMVVRPSFSSEYAVRLHPEKPTDDFDTAAKLFLTYATASQNIWYSLPMNSSGKRRAKVTVSFATVEIPRPLAERIQQLWERMLLRTRYPEERVIGMDGTTFEFETSGLYGRVWSPAERKSPLLFAELGESLIGYCKAEPSARLAAAREIEDKASVLEQYLKEHPSK